MLLWLPARRDCMRIRLDLTPCARDTDSSSCLLGLPDPEDQNPGAAHGGQPGKEKRK